jgi:competence protein ComEC
MDHVGGLPELVTMVPVGRFIDHGVNRESETIPGGRITVRAWDGYQKVLEGGHVEHLVVKPGDVLPVKAFRVEVVSADGQLIQSPLPGAGEKNSACESSPEKEIENNENDRSVGMMITFGKLRILDLGDLTWGEERPLMCPINKLGKVDIYLTSHHGLDRSGSPALVKAIAPRVVVINNGPHKGGVPTTFDTVEGSSRLKDIWQLHTAEANDAKHNTAESHIANLPGPDAGNYLKVTAREDGTFSVTNARTSESVDYSAQ